MGRPRKTKVAEEAPTVQALTIPEYRDWQGKINGPSYSYKADGSIDWRALVPKEHITLNAMNLAGRGIDIYSLDKETLSKMVDESSEEDLVIKLAGFREIAKIRGFRRLDSQILESREGHVTVKVVIEWIPNWENPYGLEVSAIASASRDSVEEKFAKYLETIAENRAFVRAVRHSLGIIAVGQDEIKQDDIKIETRNIKLHSMLLDLMQKADISFEDLKSIFRKEGLSWEEKWTSVDKIDQSAVVYIIPILKNIPK